MRSIPLLTAALLLAAASAVDAQDLRRATARAGEMARMQASAAEVAREMQRTYRLDGGQTVVVLHQVGYVETELAAATAETYRAGAEAVASLLAQLFGS